MAGRASHRLLAKWERQTRTTRKDVRPAGGATSHRIDRVLLRSIDNICAGTTNVAVKKPMASIVNQPPRKPRPRRRDNRQVCDSIVARSRRHLLFATSVVHRTADCRLHCRLQTADCTAPVSALHRTALHCPAA
ncbi:hypothetical protein NFJ02_01g39120 [Pycnococcus provasolii]